MNGFVLTGLQQQPLYEPCISQQLNDHSTPEAYSGHALFICFLMTMMALETTSALSNEVRNYGRTAYELGSLLAIRHIKAGTGSLILSYLLAQAPLGSS